MAGKCRTCAHPDIELIDAALVRGVPNRRIATHFSLSEASVRRHAKKHLPELLIKAHAAEKVLQADKILARTTERRARIDAMFDVASEMKNGVFQNTDLALATSREARSYDELLLRASGQWVEKKSLELSGQVSARVERQEAASLAFIRERYPKLMPQLADYLKQRIREENGQ